MKSYKKYFAFALIQAKSNFAYTGEIVSRAILFALLLFVLLKLWQATYAQQGVAILGGLTLVQMLWYFMITEANTTSVPRISQVVDEDIRTGTIAVQLLRPASYLLMRLSSSLGERMVSFLTNLAIGSAIIFCFLGTVQTAPKAFLMLLLALPLAFTIDFLGNFLVGLAAFWIEDTSGLLLVYSKITWVLGGMLLPLELFPQWCRNILYYLPFSQIIYGPARIFVHPDWSELFLLLIRQLISLLVMAFITNLVYRRALNQVFANGG